jgi:hypothetical protein
MVTSKFNHQTGILETTFAGEVSLKEIVDYIVATKENTSYPGKLKIITDASKAKFIFQASDLKTIVEENNKSLKKYDVIIDAIIVTVPQTTALSVLYRELAKNKKYKFNVFSTKEAAIRWLENF